MGIIKEKDGLIYCLIKRIFDICFSFTVLLLSLPLFVVIAIAIRLSSMGPVIFAQRRAGKDGIPFIMYKFRTMRTDADPFGASPKSGEDPRLTRTGKFLREYSLDELPQLINMLKGDMTLVGPRPLYISQMAEWDERQKKRLLVKPGLTGLAQVSGRGGLTREEKLELDVKYVETAGFGKDIKIVLATFAAVFGKQSIYEKNYSKNETTRGQGKSNES